MPCKVVECSVEPPTPAKVEEPASLLDGGECRKDGFDCLLA